MCKIKLNLVSWALPTDTPPTVPLVTNIRYTCAGGSRATMQVINHAGGTSGIYHLCTDHLGSTSGTVDANGNPVSTLLYTAFGETRFAYGATNTDYRYTGQREEAELGLYFYNARWYDPSLGRFIIKHPAPLRRVGTLHCIPH